jgi:excisionase family DNA binding protein
MNSEHAFINSITALRPSGSNTRRAMLTVKQTAERLGISPALVYGLCRQKRLRHERHGLGRGRILVPEDAVEEYRRRCTVAAEVGPTPAPAPAVKLEHLRL